MWDIRLDPVCCADDTAVILFTCLPVWSPIGEQSNPGLTRAAADVTSQAQTPWFVDASALHLARFKRSESTRLSSKSVTASWHRERQTDLLCGASLSSRGSIPRRYQWHMASSYYLSRHYSFRFRLDRPLLHESVSSARINARCSTPLLLKLNLVTLSLYLFSASVIYITNGYDSLLISLHQ